MTQKKAFFIRKIQYLIQKENNIEIDISWKCNGDMHHAGKAIEKQYYSTELKI
jgi:hypothetical protein